MACSIPFHLSPLHLLSTCSADAATSSIKRESRTASRKAEGGTWEAWRSKRALTSAPAQYAIPQCVLGGVGAGSMVRLKTVASVGMGIGRVWVWGVDGGGPGCQWRDERAWP